MQFVSVEAEGIVQHNSIKQYKMYGKFSNPTALFQGENSET